MKTRITVIIMTFMFVACINSDNSKLYDLSNYYLVSDTTIKNIHNQNLRKQYFLFKNDTTYSVGVEFGDKDSIISFYHNRKRNGPTEAYLNGKRWFKDNLKNDLQDGLQITFDENGDTLDVEEYRNGEKIK